MHRSRRLVRPEKFNHSITEVSESIDTRAIRHPTGLLLEDNLSSKNNHSFVRPLREVETSRGYILS